jgi:transcription elongation factor GreA
MQFCNKLEGEFITIEDHIDSAIWKIFHVTGDQLKMAEKEVILTQEGLKKLEDELDTLKSVKRREIAERIKVAIGYGDISENSEYEDAKNEQAFVEGRVITLEKMLRNARIINSDDVDTNTVSVGSIVTLKDMEFGDLVEYSIVGTAESDPLQNKISNESPVGRAILGKKKGVSVDINVPAGTISYQIIDIKK